MSNRLVDYVGHLTQQPWRPPPMRVIRTLVGMSQVEHSHFLDREAEAAMGLDFRIGAGW